MKLNLAKFWLGLLGVSGLLLVIIFLINFVCNIIGIHDENVLRISYAIAYIITALAINEVSKNGQI